MVRIKNQAPPQTLADYLSGIVLEPDAAAAQVYGMIQQLRDRLAQTPVFGLAIYRAHPDRVDELLNMVGQYHALLLALQALCQGRKPGEIEFLSLPPLMPGEGHDDSLTPAAKRKAVFPGSREGLTVNQAGMLLATVLDDGTRLSHTAISVLAKNHIVTLGQLMKRWQFRDRRLMTLKKPGIGPTIINKVIRPRVALALRVDADKLGIVPAEKPKKKIRAAERGTVLVNMEEPWLAFGLTRECWDTRLWDLLTEKSFEAKKLRKLIGRRRRLTVGDILGQTKGKMARIRKTFFGKGFGPKTQHYLKAKLAALKVPQTTLVMTMAEPVPAVEEGKQ